MSINISLQIEKLKEQYNKQAEEIVKKAVENTFSKIVDRTPVGDPTLWVTNAPPQYVPGSLKNNWHCTIGSSYTGAENSPDESGADSDSSISSTTAQYKINKDIYLTNNMPYADIIEYGAWSSQAPAGMARISVQEFPQEIEEAAK